MASVSWMPVQRTGPACTPLHWAPAEAHPLAAPLADPQPLADAPPRLARSRSKSVVALTNPLSPEEESALEQEKHGAISTASGIRAPPTFVDLPLPCITNEIPLFSEWSSKKTAILQKYTTNESIGISVKFMSESSDPVVKPPVDKVKTRLEQLDVTVDAHQEVLQLTQSEYIRHIEALHEEMISAWEGDERVKTLKIAIQCAKVLGDTSVIKFYPSKFVLVTEILDTFGDSVYDRIKRRSFAYENTGGPPRPLPDDFTMADVSAHARETARNWFFKISSIRELLPRLYVEMSILKCYRFLSDDAHAEILARLCSMIRGISNPLVATFARCYLARKGWELVPMQKDYLMNSFFDHLLIHNLLKEQDRLQAFIARAELSMPEYLDMFSPALEWILQCIANHSTMEIFTAVLRKYKENNTAIILHHIIGAWLIKPIFISQNALPIANLIKNADKESYPKHKIYIVFGKCLILSPPIKDDRLVVLNDVWKVVTKFTVPVEYASVLEVWIEYPLKYMQARDVNTMLGDAVVHLKPNHAHEALQGELKSVVLKILAYYHDFGLIFNMDNFLPFLDLFVGETQIEVHKVIMQHFARYQDVTSDPVIINAMCTIGSVLHDSVNTLTFQDESRQISKLLCLFVERIDFGRDVEKQLNFYVECRRAFGNLDAVKNSLVLGVNNICCRTWRVVAGRHTKKTAAFVRACVAYCFITIPSMEDVFQRLQLYLVSGEVALNNQSLPQADACFKAAITLVQELGTFPEEKRRAMDADERLATFISNFLSALVVVPGHPEYGAFYITKGLLRVINEYPWQPRCLHRGKVLLNTLALFTTYAQKEFPYHATKVDSNDILYEGDSEYNREIQEIVDGLLSQALEFLASLKEDPEYMKVQGQFALLLFDATMNFAQLNTKTAVLASNLFQMVRNFGAYGNALTSLLHSLELRDGPAYQDLAARLRKV